MRTEKIRYVYNKTGVGLLYDVLISGESTCFSDEETMKILFAP